jgi:hypothetical protein
MGKVVRAGSHLVLSPSAWAALLCVGGGVGTIASKLGASTWAGAALAGALGTLAAVTVVRFTRWLERHSRFREPWSAEGTFATVLHGIARGKTGEILYTREGGRACLPAISASGAPIEPGTEVVVIHFDKGVASVAPL